MFIVTISSFLKKYRGLVATIEQLYDAVFKLEIIDVCLTTEDPQEVFGEHELNWQITYEHRFNKKLPVNDIKTERANSVL